MVLSGGAVALHQVPEQLPDARVRRRRVVLHHPHHHDRGGVNNPYNPYKERGWHDGSEAEERVLSACGRRRASVDEAVWMCCYLYASGLRMAYVVDDGDKEVGVVHLVKQRTRGRLVVIDRRPQVPPQLPHTREEEKGVRGRRGRETEEGNGWETSRGPSGQGA